MTWFNPSQKKAFFALLLLAGVIALVFYWRAGPAQDPGDLQVRTGNYRLEDGQYEEAVQEFSLALQKVPDHVSAQLGLGIAYMQLKLNDKAMAAFDRAIVLDPEMAVAYADRGILHDHLGHYELALADYKKSLALDAEVLEGPGFLWRFMRNIEKKPPVIKDRAEYLELELSKPPEDRLLRVPEEDAKQRMYKAED